jgi:hypothetical protein
MIIYDIEIANAIPPESGPRETGVNYCADWRDFPNMGLAALCAWDCQTEMPRVFCLDNLHEFQALANRHETLVGFNNLSFDNELLAALGCPLPAARSYDLLHEIYRALGERRKGYKLEALAQANFSLGKSGDGAFAPVQWQRRKVGTVIDYCMRDVMLTKRLLDRVIRCGQLKDPTNGEWLRIRRPH